jgi:alkylation response protein AidB-like acyl-CoA dehydrogenase
MDFTLGEEQQALKDGAERFVADRYDFESRRKRLAALSGTDRAMWAQFAQLGWTAVLVPEAQGGLGWSMLEAAVLLEELGRGLVTEPVLEGAVLAPSLLSGCGSEAAKALLSAIVAGDMLVVPAMLEAGSRYRFDGPATTARREGDGYRLSGGKILVAGGDEADVVLVTADLDGRPALIAVPMSALGARRRTYRLLDGSWAADIRFDAVQLDRDALLSDDAAHGLARAWDQAALGAGALAVGSMEKAIQLTSAYLHTRQQFGQPLAGFQVLQHRMADLFVQAAMAKSALLGGLAVLDGEDNARSEGVSAARARIDRAALDVGNACIHLHGGMGMTEEYPVGHYYRRIVQLARSFGDSEYHLERYERLTMETV